MGRAFGECVRYLGDPAQGGLEVARTNLLTALPPGGSVEVFAVWDVPSTVAPLRVFAVVDPQYVSEDSDRLNNVASDVFVKADLGVGSIGWTKITETLVSLTARVANEGSLTNEVTTLRWMLGGNTTLFTNAVPALAPGASVDLSFLFDVSGLDDDAELIAVLDPISETLDFDAGNNAARFTIPRVARPVPPQLAALELLDDGAFRFTLVGEVGQAYTIEVSNDLVDWIELTSVVAQAATMTLTDLDAGGQAHRFYRARLR